MPCKPDLACKYPICRLGVAAMVALSSACGVPVGNDVVFEIMAATGGSVGKVVLLKTSKALSFSSLDDAQQSWLGLSWQVSEASLCKGMAPASWSNVKAYDFLGANIEAKSDIDVKTDRAYHLRICATQLNDPKAIAAIGFVVSSQKVDPDKPT